HRDRSDPTRPQRFLTRGDSSGPGLRVAAIFGPQLVRCRLESAHIDRAGTGTIDQRALEFSDFRQVDLGRLLEQLALFVCGQTIEEREHMALAGLLKRRDKRVRRHKRRKRTKLSAFVPASARGFSAAASGGGAGSSSCALGPRCSLPEQRAPSAQGGHFPTRLPSFGHNRWITMPGTFCAQRRLSYFPTFLPSRPQA